MPATPLLLRYLSGDATPEEAAMIDTWIQASEENKVIFQRLWNLWQQTTANGGYAAPDTQQEWKELLQKLPSATTLPPRRRLMKQWQVLTIATVIAVMVIVIILLLRHTDNQQPAYTTQQSNNTIARDTLFHTIMATLDTHSNIQYSAVTGKENRVSLQQGGLFLEAAADTLTTYHIEAGGVSIQPGNNSLYLQYDTGTAITTIQAVTGALTIQAGANTLTLQQGEAISWNNRQQAFGKKQATDVNSYSYATRVFLFNDTPLKEAIRYLAKAYGVSINIQTPVIGDCLITTRFDNKSIEYIMDIISATLHVNYDYQKAANTIYLQGDGCE